MSRIGWGYENGVAGVGGFARYVKQFGIIFLAMLCSLALAQAQNSSALSKASNWKKSRVSRYSIEHPSNWEVLKDGLMGTSFILLSPLESSQDVFRENINLLEQDLSDQHMDLSALATFSEDQVKRFFPEAQILLNQREKSRGVEYHRMVHRRKEGTYTLEFDQYIWVLQSKAVILTFAAELNQVERYADLRARMMGSLVLPKSNR